MCCSYSGSDWESRPLQPGPALAAARDVLYLLPLQELLERATQLPQERFTQVTTVIIVFGFNLRVHFSWGNMCYAPHATKQSWPY